MNQGLTIVPPPVVGEALRRLEARGFQAWCVGGCVRDSLLGKAPSDWDIATSALPQETKACFAGERLVEAGAAHGTIAWVPSGDHPIEITSFRSDGAYTDGRHPDSVAFSRRLEDDLSRRDFTVNAMAWHPQRGLVDLFHGQEDLSAGLLRCVGEPARRFSEDALRILRCLRFSSQLGFAIHPRYRPGAVGEKGAATGPLPRAGAGGAGKAPLWPGGGRCAAAVRGGGVHRPAGAGPHEGLRPGDALPLLRRVGAHPPRGGLRPPSRGICAGPPCSTTRASPAERRAPPTAWPISTAIPRKAAG